MLVYQLINNEELDKDFDFISVAPAAAEILEVDQRFIGTLFIGGPHVLFQTDDLSIAHEKQILLQNLGIYLDIKTIEKIEEQEQAKPKKDLFKEDDERIEKVERVKGEEKNANIELSIDEMIAGLTLADPESHIEDKNSSHRSPNINYGELELDEFDPSFDKHKHLED